MDSVANPAFLWAFCINTNGEVRHVDANELPYTPAENEYLWIHTQSDTQEAINLLQSLNLAEDVVEGLTALETRPRALSLFGGTLVYLRGINVNPGAEPEDMVSLRLWFNDNILITTRRHERSLMSVQDAKDNILQGDVPSSPADLLVLLVGKIADRISDMVDNIDEGLVGFETAESYNKRDRQALASLRRRSASIRRYLAPQRDALDALFRLPQVVDEEHAHDLREQADRMTRYVEDLDLARERAIVLQDELRNHIADQQGIRMYVLSMVTAVFLPLSFLTGVFGMNVAGLPGTESPSAFVYLMASMAGLAIVMLIAMLWKRWL